MTKKNNNRNTSQDIAIARLEEQLAAEKEAKEIAYTEMQRRLEGMNEFRRQLDSQANTFVTKDELAAMEARIDGESKLVRSKIDWILWIFILSSVAAIAINQFI